MRLVYVRDAEGNLREQLEGAEEATFEPLQLGQCYELLEGNVIGRVGFLSRDHPVVLPVTYGLDDHDVVFRTAPGSKLHIAETEILPVVFEVDEYDHETGRGAGLVIHGSMDPVLNEVEAARLDRLNVKPYADAVPRSRWVRIRPRQLQGWSFSGPRRQSA